MTRSDRVYSPHQRTALVLTGCDDQREAPVDEPTVTPVATAGAPPPATATSSPAALPSDPVTGSQAPAPDQPGPESVPTPSEQLAGG